MGIIVLGGLYIFVTGYRLSPMQAVRANTFVPGNANLIEEVDLEWGKCYLLQTPDQFFMAGCEKDGFLWVSHITCYTDRRPDDGVNTLAYLGWGPADDKRVTIFAVQTSDPQVAYVEAGEGSDRTRQSVSPGTPVVFQWTHTEIWLDDLAAHALSADGRLLYEYRYADESHCDSRELLWYPVDDPAEAWYPVDKSPDAS